MSKNRIFGTVAATGVVMGTMCAAGMFFFIQREVKNIIAQSKLEQAQRQGIATRMGVTQEEMQVWNGYLMPKWSLPFYIEQQRKQKYSTPKWTVNNIRVDMSKDTIKAWAAKKEDVYSAIFQGVILDDSYFGALAVAAVASGKYDVSEDIQREVILGAQKEPQIYGLENDPYNRLTQAEIWVLPWRDQVTELAKKIEASDRTRWEMRKGEMQTPEIAR